MTERKKALTVRPAAYAVGYGKPPAHSRFTPGRSGNPKGRPKGARNRPAAPGHQENRLQSIILDEAYRGVPVNDGKRQVTIPMAQAVVRSLAVNAAKGSQRAQRLFTALITSTERERRKARECELEGAITYKVAWERELERRRRLGIIAEDPLPHPDDIVIDVGDGTVVIKGPATKEEKVLWEIWTEQQTTFENDLRELEAYLEDPNATEREEALQDVAKLTECLKIVRLALSGSRPVLRFLKSVSDSIADDHG
jgi:Family of unknown function (DUF5681)